jgi:hypothetical protein
MVTAGPEKSATPEEGLIRIPAAVAFLLLVAVVRLPGVDVMVKEKALTDALIPDGSATTAFLLLDPVGRPPVIPEIAGTGREQSLGVTHRRCPL